jgi:hypothetical protein
LYVVAYKQSHPWGRWYLKWNDAAKEYHCGDFKEALVFASHNVAEVARKRRSDYAYFETVTLDSATHYEALGENRYYVRSR